MSDRNRQVLYDLQKRAGNNVCADCKSKEQVQSKCQTAWSMIRHRVTRRLIKHQAVCTESCDWASSNIGVFLCVECAGVHRSLGVDTSRIKSIKLDSWDDDLVKKMAEIGNDIVNKKYEQFLPPYYKRPSKNDAGVLRSQFIHAKYLRKEFMFQDKKPTYSANKMEGMLMKRGKKNNNYAERKFILNSKDNYLQYFKPNAKEPKDTLPLDDVNVVFCPNKIGNSNGFQITYLKNGQTRNLFLYCDDSKEAVDWYTAIRSAKLERRKLAFPDRDEAELCKDLTQDFICEGYLKKKGPRNEPYRTRWFTLDRRKLMYLESPLSAFPKGEVYIGHKDANYYVGNTENTRSETLEFVLQVSGRTFDLKADSIEEKEMWIDALQNVINTPPTPQDLRLFTSMQHK